MTDEERDDETTHPCSAEWVVYVGAVVVLALVAVLLVASRA